MNNSNDDNSPAKRHHPKVYTNDILSFSNTRFVFLFIIGGDIDTSNKNVAINVEMKATTALIHCELMESVCERVINSSSFDFC